MRFAALCLTLALSLAHVFNTNAAENPAKAANSKARTFDFEVKSYSDAEKNKNFVRFDMQATFLFFFKKNIKGFVKKMNVSGEYADSQLQNGVITIEAQQLDTNKESRNRKLLEEGLNAKTFPELKIRFGTPVQLNGARNKIIGSIEVRGSTKPLEMSVTTKETKDTYVIDGEADFSLSQMGIQNLSTFFTKVSERVNVTFHLDVNKSDLKVAAIPANN